MTEQLREGLYPEARFDSVGFAEMHYRSRENASHGLELMNLDPFVRPMRPTDVARTKQGYGLIKKPFEESRVSTEGNPSDGGNMSWLSLDGFAETLDEQVVCIRSSGEEASSPPLYDRGVFG